MARSRRWGARGVRSVGVASLVSLAAGLIVIADTDPAPLPTPSPHRSSSSPTRYVPLVTSTAAATDETLAIFDGLGAWVDLFDLGLDHIETTRSLAARGVRTLYLQTARSNSETMVDKGVGRWLVAAHRAGLRVVGWYLPFYAQVPFDVERAVAVARFRAAGHAFDGVGIDIEYRAAVRGPSAWNARVVRHLDAVRARLGPGVPLAAIVPTPLQMSVAPEHWAGFPWRQIADSSDALLLMSYWSDRRGCPQEPRFCAYGFTTRNVSLARELSGRTDTRIHVIGGVGDAIDDRDVADFARGARDAAADGASLYDVRTTRPRWWETLEMLSGLGR